jgi:hypothetical protein
MRMRWRRLDIPGTDACELAAFAGGWRVTGVAVFGSGSSASRLHYAASCDPAWQTIRAEVDGTIGSRALRLEVRRAPSGEWHVNDAPAPTLRGLVDLDLGFTPATNLFPIRRLALQPGQAADAAAAWLDDTTWEFTRLPQRYERRDTHTYWYESPTAGYADLLTVTADGFVREYPGLWTAVA